MKIATIGRGNVGGGLAKRWRNAGHEVTELGSDGGDVSDADVILVAMRSNVIADALGKVKGIGSRSSSTRRTRSRDEPRASSRSRTR